jgi:pyruvate dehydrogenase E2 component (dihydrolipoamide acetyltransferase)
MATPVLMPRQGNTVESCLILSWKKQPGESVQTGEIVCEVETDKAVFEVPAPETGVLLERFFEEGDDVPVLTNIAVIGAEGESTEEFRPDGGVVGETPPAVAAGAGQENRGQENRGQENRQAVAAGVASGPAGVGVSTVSTMAPRPHDATGRVGVSPRARRRAEREGIDPMSLAGSGPGGRVIERDVLAAADSRQPMTPAARELAGSGVVPSRGSGIGGRITSADVLLEAARAPVGEVAEVPVRGMRKLIADRMLASLQTTAQLTLNGAADARAMLALRKRFKGSPESLGLQGVTVNDLLLYAVARLLPEYPEVNAILENDAIMRFPTVDLAFAVDTPRGLMVPVIRQAEVRSLRELAAETRRLAEECQEGHINPDELAGGTFTLTNLGNLGVRTFTPILNPPQVAILGVGGITLEPRRADSGEVEFVDTISLSLTIDHRAVDGAPAARFLAALGEAIANIDLVVLG